MSAELQALTHALAVVQAEVSALQTRKSNIENSDKPYAEALCLALDDELASIISEIAVKSAYASTLTTLKNEHQ